MKKMSRTDIPDFIDEVIATGCNPTAVGDGYLIGDTDLPGHKCETVQVVPDEIVKRYGSRDRLLAEIALYLTSMGRAHQLPSMH